jgi:anti-sigma factor RsiW
MTCRSIRSKISIYLDGGLEPAAARATGAHLETCAACRGYQASIQEAMDALAEMPRVSPPESIAQRVRERLEVERRGPGLALLFRSRWSARPLILPSLLPAALTVLVILAGAVLVSRDPRATVQWETTRVRLEAPALREAQSGTEGNPLFPSAQVALPRLRSGQDVPVQALVGMSEGSVFLETVVARDGSVSAVTLLEGNSEQAQPLLDAYRKARFEPVRVKGRLVAVSVYRLISRMEVLPAPRT